VAKREEGKNALLITRRGRGAGTGFPQRVGNGKGLTVGEKRKGEELVTTLEEEKKKRGVCPITPFGGRREKVRRLLYMT